MPLKIKPVRVGDLERLVEIEVASLKALEIFRFLYPKGIDASREESMHTETRSALANDTTAEYMKVIDTEKHNKIVAFAKWQTPGKILADLMSTSIYPGTKKCQLTPATPTGRAGTLTELLLSQASSTRQRIMANKPHCFLAKIATDPNYQGQEAASILLRKMCRAADERQLSSYSESSPLAFSLYEACGFVEVDTIKVDLRPWGGMSDYILKYMVRPSVKLE